MSGRSRPPRMREAVAARRAAERKRSRLLFLTLIPLLLLVVGVLGFGLLERNLFRPRFDATVERSDMFVKAGEHIQVDVVNACGVDGLATKFTEFLRARRFDVPEYSTARTQEPRSKVIDRIGDPISARKVAYALGIPEERIETEIDSSLYLRATVVIGGDYQALRPMK